jgi:hypothetical protein
MEEFVYSMGLTDSKSATYFLDYEDQQLASFMPEVSHLDEKEKAIALYYHVRDAFLYDPYHLDLRPNTLRASVIVQKRRAWCVEKAIVLAALGRKAGLPTQLGYAIVTNHLGADKLVLYLRTNRIVFHGYVSFFLEGKWVKCTPAFDKRICRLAGVEPLEWDGITDSLFQANVGEQQFMEYIHEYGSFEDVPMELMTREMQAHYPHLFSETFDNKDFSFYYLRS